MQNVTKPAIAVGLLAALGIGCYTWGQHAQLGSNNLPTTSANSTILPSPLPTPSPSSNQPVAMDNAVTPVVPLPRAAYPAPVALGSQNQGTATGVTPGAAVPGAATSVTPAQNWQTQPTQSTEVTTLTRQVPMAATPATTYVEKNTVTTTTTGPIHTAYTQRAVRYKHHKTDKVHVARATKHGAMFALKLPGRLAL